MKSTTMNSTIPYSTWSKLDIVRRADHVDFQQEGDLAGVGYSWPSRGEAAMFELEGRQFRYTLDQAHCGCGRGRCTFLYVWPADCAAVVTKQQPGRWDIDPDRAPGRARRWVHKSETPGAPKGN